MKLNDEAKDRLGRVICVIFILLCEVLMVYVGINSILLPIFATLSEGISIFHSLCLLTVAEIFAFCLWSGTPSFRQMFVELADKEKERYTNCNFSSDFYVKVAKAIVTAANLVCIVIISLFF